MSNEDNQVPSAITVMTQGGGPAFPVLLPENIAEGRPEIVFRGLTRRDYFAAKAMQGIVASIDSEENYQRLRAHAVRDGMSVSQWIARDAYKQADAMIAAGKQKEEAPSERPPVEGFCLSEKTVRELAAQFSLTAEAVQSGAVMDAHTAAQLVHDLMKARGIR